MRRHSGRMANDAPTRSRSRDASGNNPEPQGSFRLTDRERGEVEAKTAPRVQVVHETIRTEGTEELSRSVAALSWSSLAGGLSMGFSMLVPALMAVHLAGVTGAFLLIELGYTTGFLIVVIARQQLFTENTLTAVLPLVTHPGWHALGRLLRLWGVVLIGNLVGVAVFALAMAHMHVLDAQTQAALTQMATHVLDNSVVQMFTKGIIAGWLLGTMVWMLPAMPGAKVVTIVLMTWLIGAGNFTHIIVGSAEMLYLVFRGELSMAGYALHFALPTLAGNIVGGSMIFGLISHAQVRSDGE